jgi:hypothetical protein
MKLRDLSEFFSLAYSSAAIHLAGEEMNVSSLVTHARHWKVSLDKTVMTYLGQLVAEKTKEKININVQLLKPEELRKLKEKSDQVILTMNAELEDIPVFSISEKKYAYEKLYSNVDTLFRSESFEKLSEIAQYDFKEAGKCVVFERSTAVAFHALRGVESVLKQFYKSKLCREPAENATWGEMEADLKRHQPSIDSAVIEQLTHIRKRYRNQTQHPRLRYDIEESQDLFNICIELVNNLSKDI